MYSKRHGLVLGFHGTDEEVALSVVSQTQYLKASKNKWDWLGHGIYFWEHSPERAREFAQSAQRQPRSKIKKPTVLGAVLDLGRCLDLLDYQNFDLLREGFGVLVRMRKSVGLPQNRDPRHAKPGDFLLRELDCAVLEAVHEVNKIIGFDHYDSVRGVFWEGEPVYPTAGFREKNHIQICIRNPNCIKGLFIPRDVVPFNGDVS
jgi:hypothetical protein